MRNPDTNVERIYLAAQGGKRTIKPYSQNARWKSLDKDRDHGCICNIEHPYSAKGGLAILFGNIAEDGCIVKTGAVYEHMHRFTGRVRVSDQQETALSAIDGAGFRDVWGSTCHNN